MAFTAHLETLISAFSAVDMASSYLRSKEYGLKYEVRLDKITAELNLGEVPEFSKEVLNKLRVGTYELHYNGLVSEEAKPYQKEFRFITDLNGDRISANLHCEDKPHNVVILRAVAQIWFDIFNKMKSASGEGILPKPYTQIESLNQAFDLYFRFLGYEPKRVNLDSLVLPKIEAEMDLRHKAIEGAKATLQKETAALAKLNELGLKNRDEAESLKEYFKALQAVDETFSKEDNPKRLDMYIDVLTKVPDLNPKISRLHDIRRYTIRAKETIKSSEPEKTINCMNAIYEEFAKLTQFLPEISVSFGHKANFYKEKSLSE